MPEWFETLPAAEQQVITASGWNKPAAEVIGEMYGKYSAGRAFLEAPEDRRVILPTDPADAAYQPLLDRMLGLSLPKSSDDYKFDGLKFKDGSELEPTDIEFVRGVAKDLKLPVAAARVVAERLMQRYDAGTESVAVAAAAAKTANEAALKAAWSTTHDVQAAGVANLLDNLKGMGVQISFDGLDQPGYLKAMNSLHTLAQQLKESPMLQGQTQPGSTPTAMTREQAIGRFEQLRQDRAWTTKALNEPTSREAQELGDIQRAMAGLPPERR